MPSLQQLEAEFIKYEKGIADKGHGRPMPDGTMQWGGFEINLHIVVGTLAEAQGINFLCPLCFVKNKGSVGTHGVSISFANRGVADDQGSNGDKGPSRWDIVGGTGLHDLQLSPSIHLPNPKGCNWHGYIGHSGVPPGHAQ